MYKDIKTKRDKEFNTYKNMKLQYFSKDDVIKALVSVKNDQNSDLVDQKIQEITLIQGLKNVNVKFNNHNQKVEEDNNSSQLESSQNIKEIEKQDEEQKDSVIGGNKVIQQTKGK